MHMTAERMELHKSLSFESSALFIAPNRTCKRFDHRRIKLRGACIAWEQIWPQFNFFSSQIGAGNKTLQPFPPAPFTNLIIWKFLYKLALKCDHAGRENAPLNRWVLKRIWEHSDFNRFNPSHLRHDTNCVMQNFCPPGGSSKSGFTFRSWKYH